MASTYGMTVLFQYHHNNILKGAFSCLSLQRRFAHRLVAKSLSDAQTSFILLGYDHADR
jgi:hypothetical protein